MAATNIFLKFTPDVKGECVESGHKDWIEIQSWSWGVTHAADQYAGGGRATGTADIQDLHLTGQYDLSTNKLFEHCATGTHFDDAVMEIWGSYGTGKKAKYLEVKMHKVFVTSIMPSGMMNDRPTLSYSLNFNKVELEYVGMNEDGTEKGKMPAGYSIAESDKV